MPKALWTLLLLMLVATAPAQEVRVYLDLQTHPSMHIPYPFFGEGLQYFAAEDPPRLSHKHTFSNVNYANYLEANAGARILVHGAIAPEFSKDKARSTRIILEELAFVNDFVAAHADRFAVARTPAEVRHLVHTTDKTIVIHSIEGAKGLVDSPADARFWAEQGIAFMTLVHLVDDEFGGAAIRPDVSTHLINLPGTLHPRRRRGLTDKGRQAIRWLAEAGIMTDLTHMNDSTRADALAFMAAEGLPPLITHDLYKPIQNHPRGITRADYLRIYQAGGLASLPISGMSLQAHDPDPAIRRELDSLTARGCHCPGSIDSYIYTYQHLQRHLEGHVGAGLGTEGESFSQLTEAEKVRYAIGFQSDFNGWLEHSRPRYGKEGCWEIDPEKSYAAIEVEGMPHPGLLASQWQLMAREGVDLDPVLRSSERFLQLWEYFRGDREDY